MFFLSFFSFSFCVLCAGGVFVGIFDFVTWFFVLVFSFLFFLGLFGWRRYFSCRLYLERRYKWWWRWQMSYIYIYMWRRIKYSGPRGGTAGRLGLFLVIFGGPNHGMRLEL